MVATGKTPLIHQATITGQHSVFRGSGRLLETFGTNFSSPSLPVSSVSSHFVSDPRLYNAPSLLRTEARDNKSRQFSTTMKNDYLLN